jgi:hypothetical protein
MASSSDDSEDDEEKRRRAELLSCIVTGDQVQKAETDRVEARQERQARQAAAASGATTGADASHEAVQTGFEKHATNRLHALLERTFETSLQPGVWSRSSIERGLEVPVSELQLFAGRELLFRHVHPLAAERVGEGAGWVGAAAAAALRDTLNNGALACREGCTDEGESEKAGRKAARKAERRAGREAEEGNGQGNGKACADETDRDKARRKAERKAARKAERRAGREAEGRKAPGREEDASIAKKKAKRHAENS